MADFKTPNLCGANESLNTALSKIDDIKAEIESKLDSAASEAAAAFETAQADIKAGLDALAVDLPEAKPVNLQSEITSLINDIDKTTAEGIASFNAKVAELKKDFGGALEKKGLDFDKLIDDSSAKLGKDVAAVSTALDNATLYGLHEGKGFYHLTTEWQLMFTSLAPTGFEGGEYASVRVRIYAKYSMASAVSPYVLEMKFAVDDTSVLYDTAVDPLGLDVLADTSISGGYRVMSDITDNSASLHIDIPTIAITNTLTSPEDT